MQIDVFRRCNELMPVVVMPVVETVERSQMVIMAQMWIIPANEGTSQHQSWVIMLNMHVLERRKVSPTQPGRGIRKIVDLYHNVADLLQKAQQHSFVVNESNQEEMNETGFTGRTEDDLEEERKEYAVHVI
jgi:hypothetical protein